LNFPGINKQTASELHCRNWKMIGETRMLSKMKIIENKVLLNLVNHKAVVWTFRKLCISYKYVNLLG